MNLDHFAPVTVQTPPLCRYVEYTRRKKELAALYLTPQEYERRIAILAAGLGV